MRFPALFLLFAALGVNAQVMQNMDYKSELEHAQSLLAGVSATDIPHHVHYDLKLYDRDGHESTATYDIYRDPILYERIDIKAGDYQFTQIINERDHKSWFHYTGEKPLKNADFEQVIDMPRAAVDRLAQEPDRVGNMQPQQLEGAPLLCANDNAGTAICFNPLIRMFAYAQMFTQTVMYDQWLPVGTHTVPGSIRIYDGKKLIVEATGTVEQVKKFPEHFIEVPQTPSQPDPGELHKAEHYKEIDLSQARYGNVSIHVSVDEQGHVTKAEIIDSDDKHLEGEARKFARGMVFAPSGAPFETVVYMSYYPFM